MRSPPSRRRGWLLLELLAGLVLASLLLATTATRNLLAARARARALRRQRARYLLRGLAAELPHSREGPRPRHLRLDRLRGLRHDLARLRVPAAARRELERLHLDIQREGPELVLRVVGPGVREERRLPWTW